MTQIQSSLPATWLNGANLLWEILQMQIMHVQLQEDGTVLLVARVLNTQLSNVGSPPTDVSDTFRLQSSDRPVPPLEHVSWTFKLEHDPAGQAFVVCGEPLPLSRQEYRLLRYFVERPGQLLGHAQLLKSVWEDALSTDRGALQSCIYRLRLWFRERLGEEAPRPFETRRGGGYRWDPEPTRLTPPLQQTANNSSAS